MSLTHRTNYRTVRDHKGSKKKSISSFFFFFLTMLSLPLPYYCREGLSFSFHFISGYAIVHLLRSPFFFLPSVERQATCLRFFGGPIYDGVYSPPSAALRKNQPTFSEDLASAISNNLFVAGFLCMGLAGGGVGGLTGGALAMLFDGPKGRERWKMVKKLGHKRK